MKKTPSDLSTKTPNQPREAKMKEHIKGWGSSKKQSRNKSPKNHMHSRNLVCNNPQTERGEEGWILYLCGWRNCSSGFEKDSATIPNLAFDSQEDEDQMRKIKEQDWMEGESKVGVERKRGFMFLKIEATAFEF